MKTKPEILRETVEHYKTHPRSLAPALDRNSLCACLYAGPNGALCAFSRVVMREHRHFLVEAKSAQDQFFLGAIADEHLLPAYRGHDPEFWTDVQTIHDDESYWQGQEFTRCGEERLAELLTRYSN